MVEFSDLSICVEVALSSRSSPQYESQYCIKPNTPFSNAILEVIDRISPDPDINLANYEIKTGRFPKSGFLPIGVSDKIMEAWRESQKNKCITIPIEETSLNYGKIIEKYKVNVFHITQKK
jgi:hypothetical protein